MIPWKRTGRSSSPYVTRSPSGWRRCAPPREIGTSLEAEVVLKVPVAEADGWKERLPLLPTLFITSSVVLEEVEGLEEVMVEAHQATGEKCMRCWNRRARLATTLGIPNYATAAYRWWMP